MAKMDIKKLALDHGEKAAFGLFALIALLALIGTHWKPYGGTPSEITKKITAGKRTLKANTWPEEELEKYAISKEAAPANVVYDRLRKDFSPALVQPSGRMVVNAKGGGDPVREPILEVPQELIASSARVFLNMLDETELDTATQEKELAAMPEKDDSAVPDEFRQNTNSLLGGPGGMTEAGSYASLVDLPESMGMPGDPLMEGMEGMEGIDGMAGGPSQPELNGQGRHFISVRAVFPLRDQITKYADAIQKSFHAAAATFDIRNFELQRQTAQPGDDPWSGPWEEVDLKVAADVLDNAAGFDAEVVNSMITNAVITMPLPMRISGKWAKQATHPKIERFELSDSEIATEVEMQRKLLAEAVEKKMQMDATTVKRGGFSSFVLDPRQLNQDVLNMGMFGGGSGFRDPGMDMGMDMGMAGPGGGGGRPRGGAARTNPMQKLIEDMAKGSNNKTEEEKRIREWIQSLASAEGELLLFRYLDFSVEPGKTYRYRVRFVLANPNFGKRIADAGGLNHVVEGETRTTEWSNITQPTTVEKDVKYFLTGIDEKFSKVLPTVHLDVFEWAAEHGTFVNDLLEVRFGQQLVQTKETTVMDPAKHFNEKKEFTFNSTDYLVDTLDYIQIDEDFHEKADPARSVKLPVGSRGKIATAPKALVSSADRQLSFLSPVNTTAERKKLKNYMELQGKLFEYLKVKEVSEDDALLDLGLGLPSEMDSPEMENSRGKGPRNSLRVKRGRSKLVD